MMGQTPMASIPMATYQTPTPVTAPGTGKGGGIIMMVRQRRSRGR